MEARPGSIEHGEHVRPVALLRCLTFDVPSTCLRWLCCPCNRLSFAALCRSSRGPLVVLVSVPLAEVLDGGSSDPSFFVSRPNPPVDDPKTFKFTPKSRSGGNVPPSLPPRTSPSWRAPFPFDAPRSSLHPPQRVQWPQRTRTVAPGESGPLKLGPDRRWMRSESAVVSAFGRGPTRPKAPWRSACASPCVCVL